jgi:hypothetical protein
MVLAGYGGASLLFFGVSPSMFSARSSKSTLASLPRTSLQAKKTAEEEQLANAVDAAEAEAVGDGPDIDSLPNVDLGGGGTEKYSWWDVLCGKHDQEIFEQSTVHTHDSEAEQRKKRASAKGKTKMKATAVRFLYMIFFEI